MPASWNARWEGEVAGKLDDNGYIQIYVNKKPYKAHRLAWFYVYGTQPDEVDHKEKPRSNNRLSNLRAANSTLNQYNTSVRNDNVLGHKGVSKDPRGSGYRARIRVDGKSIYLGYFNNPEDASAAYIEAAKRYHKSFARWGDTVNETVLIKSKFLRPMPGPKIKRHEHV